MDHPIIARHAFRAEADLTTPQPTQTWDDVWLDLNQTLDAPYSYTGPAKVGVDRVLVNTAVNAFKHPEFRAMETESPAYGLSVRLDVGAKLKARVSDGEFQRYIEEHVFDTDAYQTAYKTDPVAAARCELRAGTELGYRGPRRVPAAIPDSNPA